MLYSHDCLPEANSLAATLDHVVAHLSSVCSYDDSEVALASMVELKHKTLPNGMFRVTGSIDMEPAAPYMGHQGGARRTLSLPGNVLAEKIQAGLTKYGVKWRVLSGAPTRGNGQSWDITGGLMHHTATALGAAPRVLWEGRPDLAPPLSNTAGEADGTVAFVAYYPANHAGASGGKSMGPLPVTNTFNKRVWGHEIVYPGVSPMTVAQYRSAVILGKVIAEVLGVSAEHIRAHGETSITGKWDPGYANGKTIDMAAYRRDIGTPGTGDNMALTDQDIRNIWGWKVGNNFGDKSAPAFALLQWADAHSGIGRGAIENSVLPALARMEARLAGMGAADVDEAAIVKGIMAQLTPMIRSAVAEALGDDNKDQADKILAALGAKLAP